MAHDKPDSAGPSETSDLSRDHLTFSDGDVSFESDDGVTFQLDSVVLRRASPVWSSMIAQHLATRPKGRNDVPAAMIYSIKLDEKADPIDAVLRSIYPPFSTSAAGTSVDRATAVLRVMAKYQIPEDLPVGLAASSCIANAEPPIRAWCLAVKSGSQAARAGAVRRFLRAGTASALPESLPEMDGLNALEFNRLLRLREAANSQAEAVLRAFIHKYFCSLHRGVPFLAMSLHAPFIHQPLLAEKTALSSFAAGMRGCAADSKCTAKVMTVVDEADYPRVQHALDGVMNAAVECEARGGTLPDVAVPELGQPGRGWYDM